MGVGYSISYIEVQTYRARTRAECARCDDLEGELVGGEPEFGAAMERQSGDNVAGLLDNYVSKFDGAHGKPARAALKRIKAAAAAAAAHRRRLLVRRRRLACPGRL